MFNTPYMYNTQPSLDRINAQINELEKMKEQMQKPIQPQPTNLTQNFQLAPTNREVIRYANSIEDVQRDVVVGDTPYFSKDMSIVWVKSINGTIKSYELNEIVEKDPKDIQIEYLQAQINELKKGMVNNEQPTSNVVIEQDATNTPKFNEPVGEPIKEEKSTSIQRIPTGKKR